MQAESRRFSQRLTLRSSVRKEITGLPGGVRFSGCNYAWTYSTVRINRPGALMRLSAAPRRKLHRAGNHFTLQSTEFVWQSTVHAARRRRTLAFRAVPGRVWLGLLGLALSDCATVQEGRPWGEDVTVAPGWSRVGASALKAVQSPRFWGPPAAAAIFQIDGWDRKASTWARVDSGFHCCRSCARRRHPAAAL